MKFSKKTTKQHYPEVNISKRPSTFYDKTLYAKLKKHFNAFGERKDTSSSYPVAHIEDRPSMFYDKALYDKFRDNYQWNFPDDEPKIKRKK